MESTDKVKGHSTDKTAVLTVCSTPPETTHQSPPPLIIQHPSDVCVRVGQGAVLTCQAKEGVLFDWYKDGKLYAKGKRTGRLELPLVTMAHVGEYHCVVVNDGGSERSNRAKVIVGINKPYDVGLLSYVMWCLQLVI